MTGAIYAMSELRRELVTLAFVGAELEKSQDFFSALRPLFVPIAQDFNGRHFDPELLKSELLRRYGISIPEDVCTFLVSRLHSQGLLERQQATQQSALFRWKIPADVPVYDVSAVNAALDDLVNELVAFRDGFESLVFNEFEGGALLAIFLDYLKGTDEALTGAMDALGAEPQEGTTISGKKVFRDEKSYFCARFLDVLAKRNLKLMAWVSRLSTAALVSEVVLSLKDPPTRALNLANANYYLDAPLLLELLGSSGKERKADAKYTVERLSQAGALIRVLDHSVEEAREALVALRDNNPSLRYGPTHAAMVRGEVNDLFLNTLISNFDFYVEEAGVKVVDTSVARFSINQIAVFPDKTARELEGRLLSGYTLSERAAERDAMSIAFVMRSRGRTTPTRIQDAKHLLLCRNDSLHAYAITFLKQSELLAPGDLGPVFLADHVTAFIWLSAGDRDRVEIDVRHLLVQSDRLVQSSPAAIESLKARLQEVSPANAESFDALMHVPRCYQLALDLVGGSVQRAMASNVVEVFERVRKETAAEVTEQHKKSVKQIKERHQKQTAELAERSAEAEREREALQRRMQARSEQDNARANSIFESVADTRGRTIFFSKTLATYAVLAWLILALRELFEGQESLERARMFLNVFGSFSLLLSFWLGGNAWNRLFEGFWRSRLRQRASDAGVYELVEGRPWPRLF